MVPLQIGFFYFLPPKYGGENKMFLICSFTLGPSYIRCEKVISSWFQVPISSRYDLFSC